MINQKAQIIKEQERQILVEVPPMNIYVLNVEKLLTEKYN